MHDCIRLAKSILHDRMQIHAVAMHYAAGKGVRAHERKAAYWFLQAARQGCGWAAHFLGIRYIKGQGTKKDVDSGISGSCSWLVCARILG
jgi:TPR repeat protein